MRRHRQRLRCVVNRAQHVRDLAMVEGHIRFGKVHLARQRQRVATLDRGGHDSWDARYILALFEETQALHVEHRDRLQRELAANKPI
jgi:hypothetical protein